MRDIRLALYDPHTVIWLRRRPTAPRWCNQWTAGGLLLVVAAVVVAELMAQAKAPRGGGAR